MAKTPIVIAATICTLVLIYFLPRIEAAARRAYGRYRRRQRNQRQERDRRAQVERRAHH